MLVYIVSSMLTSTWSSPFPSLNFPDSFDVKVELGEKHCESQHARYTTQQAEQRTGMRE